MKFANIDDAIMEAAKKPAAKPAPKAAAKKVEPKKAPAKPAAKVAPKKAEAPVAAPKKKQAPKKITAPKKTGTKKRVVTPPPAAEPEDKGAENKETEQKPTQEKPAETKPTQSADSGEPRKFAPRWLQSKPRGIGDRLKTAWKGFTAKAGDKIDVPHKYKSVFHEIQKLMEQLQLVESMLQEQSLNESYDAGTVNNLYAHRNAIRSVLVEQIVREELYQHNVTIAELDQHQRAALMETVTLRANALWEGLNELSPAEIEAQKNSPEAKAKAAERGDRLGFGPNDRISQVGDKQRKRLGQNPHAKKIALANLDSDREQERDSNYVAGKLSHMKKQLQGKQRMAAEAYTLEEWMGMMEEAGYSLSELSPETLASYRAKATAQKSNIKDKYHGTTSPTTGQKYSRDMHGLPPEATAAGDQRKFQKRTAGIAQANQNLGQQALKNPSVVSKIDYRDDELGAGAAQWQIDKAKKSALSQPTGQPKMAAESINENTVARLQSLAGIKPTE